MWAVDTTLTIVQLLDTRPIKRRHLKQRVANPFADLQQTRKENLSIKSSCLAAKQ